MIYLLSIGIKMYTDQNYGTEVFLFNVQFGELYVCINVVNYNGLYVCDGFMLL